MARPIEYSIYDLIRMQKTGVLGLEYASAYWGMCSYSQGRPIFIISTKSSSNFVEAQISYLFADYKGTDRIKLADDLYITSREQTVCDLILYDCHEFYLYETILSVFEDVYVDREKLESLARDYNIYEKLYTLKERAESDFEEG